MTGRDLITNAYALLNIYAVGETPTASDAQLALGQLNRMLDRWRAERLTIYVIEPTTVAIIPSFAGAYTIGPGGLINVPRPVWISRINLQLINPIPQIEIPLTMFTDQDWQNTTIKTLTSTLPTGFYYDHAFEGAGLGRIFLWPVPTETNNLIIYAPTPMGDFPTLDTDLEFPPGYAEALEYNLAQRLARPYGQPPPEDVVAMAIDSLAVIKRANRRLSSLSIDPMLQTTGPRGGYNWRADTWNGGR